VRGRLGHEDLQGRYCGGPHVGVPSVLVGQTLNVHEGGPSHEVGQGHGGDGGGTGGCGLAAVLASSLILPHVFCERILMMTLVVPFPLFS